MKFLRLMVAAASLASLPAEVRADARADADDSTRCEALAGANFSDVANAPTQVVAATFVAAASEAPKHCLVTGYVAPSVGFDLRMPTDWNRKFLHLGCGGHCGILRGSTYCANTLRRGYACLTSNMGHTGVPSDGLWAYHNLQAKFDWGLRATHVTTLAGKAITEHYYSRPPWKSYFWGCSTGGRQALQEAQRFPFDFDGIVAGCPPVNLSQIYTTFLWGIRAMHDAEGKALLGEEDLKLLTATAVAQCDLDDGAEDGVIGDPLRCDFDPSKLACRSAAARACLTPSQVDAVKKIYAGPMTSQGAKLWLGGPVPGSEYGPNHVAIMDWRDVYDLGSKPGVHSRLAVEGLRYLFFFPDAGPSWRLADFDFDRDTRRLALMQSIYDSGNPDLRQFKAAGGKLIMYQGMNDVSVLPRATIDYYETVERTMGGRAETREFARLFLLPGALHCMGGDGAFAVDWLSHLEAWVENGQAPEALVGANVRLHDVKGTEFHRRLEFPLDPATVRFTRPVYPFPVRARYLGQGDPNDAANWGPAEQ